MKNIIQNYKMSKKSWPRVPGFGLLPPEGIRVKLSPPTPCINEIKPYNPKVNRVQALPLRLTINANFSLVHPA